MWVFAFFFPTGTGFRRHVIVVAHSGIVVAHSDSRRKSVLFGKRSKFFQTEIYGLEKTVLIMAGCWWSIT